MRYECRTVAEETFIAGTRDRADGADAPVRCARCRRRPSEWFRGWANTSAPSETRERHGVMPNRDLTYASSGTHGPAERAHVRCARGAGGAPFAKKTPDLACRGSDLSPQGVDWVRGRTSFWRPACRRRCAQQKVTQGKRFARFLLVFPKKVQCLSESTTQKIVPERTEVGSPV